jgi:hypothetical protein
VNPLTANSPMVSTRHVFRFTIGQGMAAIAALAVAFAFLPMPGAIILSLVTLFVMLRSRLRRRRHSVSDPARGERIGCLSFVLGLFTGAAVGAFLVTRYSDPAAVDAGLVGIGAIVACGFMGALVGGIIGHVVALSLPVQPLPPPDPTDVKREAMQAEIQYLERLLGQADVESDDEVRTKLTAHKAKLIHELEEHGPELPPTNEPAP